MTAYHNSGEFSTLNFEDWIKVQSEKSLLSLYWATVFDMELDLILFVKSLREANFGLYVESVQKLVVWFLH